MVSGDVICGDAVVRGFCGFTLCYALTFDGRGLRAPVEVSNPVHLCFVSWCSSCRCRYSKSRFPRYSYSAAEVS